MFREYLWDTNLFGFLSICIRDILPYQVDQCQNIYLLLGNCFAFISEKLTVLCSLHGLPFINSIVPFNTGYFYDIQAEFGDEFFIFFSAQKGIDMEVPVLLAKVLLSETN